MNELTGESDRQEYVRRSQEAKSERSSYDSTWQEIATYVTPYRERLLSSDTNRGEKKTQNIINNSAWRASDITAAGLQAGMTSPTRPWHRTTTRDKQLAEVESVKAWCSSWDERVRAVMAATNTYEKFHEMYLDLPTFGVSVMFIQEDPEVMFRCKTLPLGSYALATDAKGRVDTLFYWVQMTVRQLVDEFGLDKVSERVRNAFRRKAFNDRHEVLQVVEPNRAVIRSRIGSEGMAWKSVWLETGGNEKDGFLRTAGYNECPFLAPRWGTTGEDVYPSSYPGQMSIGDCKTLQQIERRGLQVLDKLSDPPMVGPSSMRDEPVDLMPGGINYEDPSTPGRGFRPAIELPAQALTAVDGGAMRVQLRIDKTWKVDFWVMFSNEEAAAGRLTATQIIEQKSEKVLQLGPMLERFHNEALRVFFARIFGIMMRYGQMPEPPPELQGQELKLEFVSILAQAQKMVAIQGIRELTSYVGQLAVADPEAYDKFDKDQAIDVYSDALGTEPSIVRSDDKVAEIRRARAEAKAKQAAAEQAAMAAQSAKTLSETNTEGDNALTRMMDATLTR